MSALRDSVQALQIRFERVAEHGVFREPAQAVRLYRQRIDGLEGQLRALLVEARGAGAERLERVRLRGGYALERALQQRQQRVDEAGLRLRHGCEGASRQRRERLGSVERQLTLLNPLAVLGRGYSLTLGSDGSVVRSVKELERGAVIRTRLEDGVLISDVRECEEELGGCDGE